MRPIGGACAGTIGGAYGEMTVTMQYLFQGWNCRVPGKYKDLILDTATILRAVAAGSAA